MNEEQSYAEMLEIPMESVTVNRKERKRKAEADLQEQLVQEVNDRMQAQDDPAYAESTPIAREEAYSRRQTWGKRILLGEFIAVCVLCATIFFTNIFMPNSAINVWVRDLVQGSAQTALDNRTYSEFTLSPIVNRTVDTEIAVSDTGVLSFTAKASVYSPVDGTLKAVNGNAETGYSVEVKHSESFSTIMSGLDNVYFVVGDSVKANIPLGFSDGEGEVRVMFYSNGSLINQCVVGENGLAWA